MKEYKIAIIGNNDAILGFKGMGIDVFGLREKNPEKAEETVDSVMNKDNYAVVFITEDWIVKLESILNKYRDKALPAVVAVPTIQGTTGAALAGLKKIVEQAVGSDILFSKK